MYIDMTAEARALLDRAIGIAQRRTARLAETQAAIYGPINAQIVELAGKIPEVDAADIETLDVIFAAAMADSVDHEREFAGLYGYIMDDQGLGALEAA